MPKLSNATYEIFCHEYMVDRVGKAAAIRAGFSPVSARATASVLLKKPEIQARIAELVDEQSKRISVTSDRVLREWWNIAMADPNELSQHRVGCCRYCYGEDHQHQWKTRREFKEALAATQRKLGLPASASSIDDPRLPDDSGGYGFNMTMAPNPECPECNGIGVGYAQFLDSTDLSERGRALYRGTKVTRNGIEIAMADKDKALENIARHLGMFAADNLSEIGDETKAFLASIMGGKAPLATE